MQGARVWRLTAAGLCSLAASAWAATVQVDLVPCILAPQTIVSFFRSCCLVGAGFIFFASFASVLFSPSAVLDRVRGLVGEQVGYAACSHSQSVCP